MAKTFQPYVGFTLEGNENNSDNRKIFPINLMQTDNGHESALLLEM